MEYRIEFRFVLAGAYRGKDISERALRAHAVRVYESGDERPLCRRVKAHNLADRYAGCDMGHDTLCDDCQARLASLVWKHTHRHYRGHVDGKRSVLTNGSLKPLECFTPTELVARLPRKPPVMTEDDPCRCGYVGAFIVDEDGWFRCPKCRTS